MGIETRGTCTLYEIFHQTICHYFNGASRICDVCPLQILNVCLNQGDWNEEVDTARNLTPCQVKERQVPS